MTDEDLATRLTALGEQVRDAERAAGRAEGSVEVLLATKTVEPSRILAAIAAGYDLIGENRVQEVTGKADALRELPHRTHFIGRLQSNKVNQLLPHIECLQSLDSADLAARVNTRLAALDRRLDVFIQVNVTGEDTKGGVTPDDVLALSEVVAGLDALRLRGFMTIGLPSDDPAAVRAGYRRLAEVRARALDAGIQGATALSMGMSGDFAEAIAEGATMIRVGSAVFGARP